MTEVTGRALRAYLQDMEDVLPAGSLAPTTSKSSATLADEIEDDKIAGATVLLNKVRHSRAKMGSWKQNMPEASDVQSHQKNADHDNETMTHLQRDVLTCFAVNTDRENTLNDSNIHSRVSLLHPCFTLLLYMSTPVMVLCSMLTTTVSTNLAHLPPQDVPLHIIFSLVLIAIFLAYSPRLLPYAFPRFQHAPANKHSQGVYSAISAVARLQNWAVDALLLVKHSELNARGYSLSGKIPPIARIEMQGMGADEMEFVASLQCVPLRRALKRTLDTIKSYLEFETNLMTQGGNVLGQKDTSSHNSHKKSNKSVGIYIYELQRKLDQSRNLFQQFKETILDCANNEGRFKLFAQRGHTRRKILLSELGVVERCIREEIGVSNKKQKQAEGKVDECVVGEREKKNKQRARITSISSPMDLAVDRTRSYLSAVSVDLFAIRQDVRQLVSDFVACNDLTDEGPILLNNKVDREWSQVANRFASAQQRWHTNREHIDSMWSEIESAIEYAARVSSAGEMWSVGKSTICRGNSLPDRDEQGSCKSSAVCGSADNPGGKSPQHHPRTASFILDEQSDKHVSVFEGVASAPPKHHRHLPRQQSPIESLPLGAPAVGLKLELNEVLAHRSHVPERIRNLDRSGWSDPPNDVATKPVTVLSKLPQKVDQVEINRHGTRDELSLNFAGDFLVSLEKKLTKSQEPNNLETLYTE